MKRPGDKCPIASNTVRHQGRALIDALTETFCCFLLHEQIPIDVRDSRSGKVILPAHTNITERYCRKLARCHDSLDMPPSPIQTKIAALIDREKEFLGMIPKMSKADRQKDILRMRRNGVTLHAVC